MPPLPPTDPGPPGERLQRVVDLDDLLDERRRKLSRRGSAVSRPSVSVRRTSRSASTRWADQRREAVVVAEADLVVGDGVVLVDHRPRRRARAAAAGCPAPGGTGRRSMKSRGARSTCPGDQPVPSPTPGRTRHISRGWPTAATAWRVTASRCLSPPRGRSPADPRRLLPTDTTTTDVRADPATPRSSPTASRWRHPDTHRGRRSPTMCRSWRPRCPSPRVSRPRNSKRHPADAHDVALAWRRRGPAPCRRPGFLSREWA